MATGPVTDGAVQAPYVGYRPFSAEDRSRFFGRSGESRRVANLWQGSRIAVISAPSGAGTTSLLQAGVIPSLKDSSIDVLPVGRVSRTSAFPIAALPEHNPYTLALLTTWSPAGAETRLASLSVLDFLSRRGRRADPGGRLLPVLAAVDRADELMTGPPDDRHRGPFIDELAEALAEMPWMHLLLCIREDYFPDFRPYLRVLGHAAEAMVSLGPISPEAAVETVRAPLAGTGRYFAAGAAEELVRSLVAGDSEAGAVEPALLQILCSGLWAALPDDVQEITASLVGRYGAVDRLLADYCNRATTAVADDHGIVPADLWSWLRDTFITELGKRGLADEGLAWTHGMPNSVARALRDWHILTATRRAGSRWYELQHDALVRPVRESRELVPGLATVPRITPADYLQAAQLAIADRDLDLAERHAAEALRASAGQDLRLCSGAESVLGNVAFARGRPDEAGNRYRAAAALSEALQDTQAVARLLAAIGQTMLRQGRRAEAVECLYSAVGRIPNDLTMQTELAWALWYAGQQRAAVSVLTGVLAIDGTAREALRARGEILADLGEAEAALRDLDRVQRRQRPSTLAARALALATLHRSLGPDPELDTALSRAPDNGPVLLYAARAAALARDVTIAAELARRAVSATDPAVPPHQREQALKLIELVG